MDTPLPFHPEVHCAHSPARRPFRRRALCRPARRLLVERSGDRCEPVRRPRRRPVQRRRSVGRGLRLRHGRRRPSARSRPRRSPRRSRSRRCRRTVIEEGTGDPVESGELVTYALTAFNAETGEKLGSIGYGEDPVLPVQISPDNPVGQILGCAAPGTRVVVAFPPADPNPGQVYVFDFIATVPNAAWGEPQEPVAGMPDGRRSPMTARRRSRSRTATPRPTSSWRRSRRVTARSSARATPSSCSTPASSGRTARCSTRAGRTALRPRSRPPAWSTASSQALEGQTVGSQVLVVIPPALGYGEAGSSDNELAGETLVFVVDILGTQHAAPAQ